MIWHLLNFVAPALCLGMLSAGVAKALWRRRLDAVSWISLSSWASAASAAALVAGLLAFGRDGRMATYALVALASSLGLWWGGMRRR